MNPAAGIEVARPDTREARFLTADEVARLAAAVPPRDRALVLLLAYRGLRFGEAAALRVRHVDWLRRRVQVMGALKESAAT